MSLVSFALAREEPTVYTSGDYTYTLRPDGTAEITGYSGNASVLSIPAELDSHTVTSLKEGSFAVCASLTSVILPDSITSIGAEAFYWCEALTSVNIPASVTSIGSMAFSFCPRLILTVTPHTMGEYCAQSENVPFTYAGSENDAAVFMYGSEEFSFGEYTYRLRSDGMAEITKYRGNAAELLIPAVLDGHTVISIGYHAFDHNKSLISVSIPAGVASIGEGAFSSCTSLTSVFLPDGIVYIGNDSFWGCSSLTGVSLPESLVFIGYRAFSFCTALTALVIPDSVTLLGPCPFLCSALNTICVSETHPVLKSIDGVLFKKPEMSLFFYPSAFTAEAYSVPEGTRSIGDYAFCSQHLISVALPETVTSVGKLAFGSCRNLTSVSVPDSVTFISEDAFEDCPALTLTVPAGSYAEQYARENSIPYICSNGDTDRLPG